MPLFKDRDTLKDCLWLLTALVCVFGPVIFPGLSDYANKPFWWKFWDAAAIACAVTLVAGWIYFWSSKPRKND